MRRAPYGGTVIRTPAVYWIAGTWILIFAGRRAWDAAKAYLDHGHVDEARERHTLVAPPDDDPALFFWPVAQRRACICDTGGVDLATLQHALVQARAAKLGVLAIDLESEWWARHLPAQPDPLQFDLALVDRLQDIEIERERARCEFWMRYARDHGDDELWAVARRARDAAAGGDYWPRQINGMYRRLRLAPSALARRRRA